jgi:hypothetical protein
MPFPIPDIQGQAHRAINRLGSFMGGTASFALLCHADSVPGQGVRG